MSEKNHGTDGVESPTERLLREALSARASAIGAHDLRPAEPPSRRLRRLRPVQVVTAVAMFGLAASVAGYFTLAGSPTASHQDPAPAASLSASPTPEESPSPSPSPSLSASASPSNSPSAPAATSYTFRNVTFDVPPGWRTVTEGVAGADSLRVCVFTPDTPESAIPAKGFGTCVPYGVEIVVWNSAEELENATWPIEQFLDAPTGWSSQPYCSVWGNPRFPEGEGYKRLGEPKRTTLTVDGHYGNKTEWQVACNANERFTAQMWGFHKEQVFVAANGLRSDYQDDLESIVQSLDLSKHADPLKMGHRNDIKVSFGQEAAVREGDTEVITFPVTWYNASATTYAAVEPVVAAESLGNDIAANLPDGPGGTLERKDGNSWTVLPSLRKGGGMDWAGTGKAAAFALAPGQSRTVTYRMKLTTQDKMAGLGVTGAAYLPTKDGTFNSVGNREWVIPIHRVK
ncbi:MULTISPECIES: hypothetical protein [unclassified Kitasatospora]|uniref:hypothetical protein n=1 Tax=unclassified Kitasatospora TaxID=2633591 RepID=UPI00070F3465|nr:MULTISPECIES: hypothetical protein [unclassified Kitasatospora]KQV15447.1 hypothetical protein ASC99_07565 [Kitasatospora sp. Root107]KRB63965.1 hypothetical protein ASE03_05300 [Kitasatospora sp. Root187]